MMMCGITGMINNVKAEQLYMKSFLTFIVEQEQREIKKGDTFYGIANDLKDLGISVDQIIDANPGVDPKNLQIGQSINIPGSNSTDNRKNIAPPTKTEAQRFSPKKYGAMMLDQGAKFLKYGNEPDLPGYDKKYDYGGSGDIPRDDKAYRQVATGVMRGMMTDIGIGSEKDIDNPKIREKLTQKWRGVPRSEDPKYYDRVESKYKSGQSSCIGAFCDAIGYAETGSFKDPWIRTTHSEAPGGSAAFGRMQLTPSTLEDHMTRHPKNFPDTIPE